MSSSGVLLFSLTLILMLINVESELRLSFGGGGKKKFSFDVGGRDLSNLYNSRVVKADRVVRPLGNLDKPHGVVSHSGVKVTLEDKSEWLIHKGSDFGDSSRTVVVNADHMSDRWQSTETKDVGGTHTVSDFVKAGGETYSPLVSDCHVAANNMMNLKEKEKEKP